MTYQDVVDFVSDYSSVNANILEHFFVVNDSKFVSDYYNVIVNKLGAFVDVADEYAENNYGRLSWADLSYDEKEACYYSLNKISYNGKRVTLREAAISFYTDYAKQFQSAYSVTMTQEQQAALNVIFDAPLMFHIMLSFTDTVNGKTADPIFLEPDEEYVMGSTIQEGQLPTFANDTTHRFVDWGSPWLTIGVGTKLVKDGIAYARWSVRYTFSYTSEHGQAPTRKYVWSDRFGDYYLEDSDVPTLTASGYNFINWQDAEGNIYESGNYIGSDLALNAVWEVVSRIKYNGTLLTKVLYNNNELSTVKYNGNNILGG